MVDEKSSLSVSDICAIIKACGENGVSRLAYGGLTLKLGGQKAPAPDPAIPAPRPAPASIEALEKDQDIEAERAFVDDETQLKADQLRMMLIEDPERAEELFHQMHLQGDVVENEQDGIAEEA